ncbi:MAG TPA: hypothetical protein DCR80_01180 [Faecalibacterium sp.]|nr:hypothetical protein [Faecalibacterium sp.]
MSEKNKQRIEKFVALCDSGKPWYVFLVLFSLLLAANALLELLTEQRVKSWVWLLNVAGIVGCVADLFHCKNLRAAKAEDENA